METGVPAPGRRQQTRARIRGCALDLFERQGFERTTVAQIAAAAGLTEMTFFRHFPAKDQVLLDDPYDPLMVAAVGAQPPSLGPLIRTVRGLRRAWEQLTQLESDVVRRQVRIVASTPALRAAAWRNTAETERAIVEQLIRDGTDPLPARAAASAVLAAVMAALLEWSRHDDAVLTDAIAVALDTLEDRRE